jgi:hypothetical protein
MHSASMEDFDGFLNMDTALGNFQWLVPDDRWEVLAQSHLVEQRACSMPHVKAMLSLITLLYGCECCQHQAGTHAA